MLAVSCRQPFLVWRDPSCRDSSWHHGPPDAGWRDDSAPPALSGDPAEPARTVGTTAQLFPHRQPRLRQRLLSPFLASLITSLSRLLSSGLQSPARPLPL